MHIHYDRRVCLRASLLAVVSVAWLAWAASVAQAQSGFAGKLNYTGSLGPISASRPLCLCVYTDRNLQNN
ncbi:MAG TPA: hypothetical protein VMT89_03190, partial [Candidatus Acidoferrales bacterium]|nr:hypothetical protein [Candidatus Acidoferrales bacterium]